MDRLYIDDVLVDMPERTDVSLSVVSNVFSDLSKISGNTTYTFKLPKTARNRRILGYADRVDERKGLIYREHRARLYRDGVEVIKKGRVSIQGATEKEYEVIITWGVCEEFQNIVNEGTTLQDLDSTAVVDYLDSNPLTELQTYVANGYGYALVDYVFMEKDENEWVNSYHMSYVVGEDKWKDAGAQQKKGGIGRVFTDWTSRVPSVTVPWLLSGIKAKTGVEFKWTGAAKTFIDNLCVPCLTRDANELTFQSMTGVLRGSFVTMPMNRDDRDAECLVEVSSESIVFGNLANAQRQRIDVVTTSTVRFSCRLVVAQLLQNVEKWKGCYEIFDTCVGVVVIHADGSEDMYKFGASQFNRIPEDMVTADRFTQTIYAEGDIDLVRGDKVCFRLQESIGDCLVLTIPIDYFVGTFMMTAVAGNEVPLGAKFPIVKNLPNIKIVDFVKFLSCVTGTFAKQLSADGVVEFKAFDSIDLQDAQDWTDRLVPSGGNNLPASVVYMVNEWAKANHYKWKEDEKTKGNFNGTLFIDDDKLDKERDVIVFPFAASDGGCAPVFKYEWEQDDEGNWNRTETFVKVEPRIYTRDEVIVVSGGVTHYYPSLAFDMDMQKIIDEKYGVLYGMLNGCKVIEETIKMNISELTGFDETRPVWLGQYGAYFMVSELRLSRDGVKAKMVKLNLNRG